jgi:hypothetical protein
MVHAKHINTHRDLFRRSEILPLPCEYIFSLITSVKITKQYFKQIQLYVIIIIIIIIISISIIISIIIIIIIII